MYIDNAKYPDSSAFSGFIADVLKKAGALLNVTFNLSVVKDMKYGSWKKEAAANWTGMIGELVRNVSSLLLSQTLIERCSGDNIFQVICRTFSFHSTLISQTSA